MRANEEDAVVPNIDEVLLAGEGVFAHVSLVPTSLADALESDAAVGASPGIEGASADHEVPQLPPELGLGLPSAQPYATAGVTFFAPQPVHSPHAAAARLLAIQGIMECLPFLQQQEITELERFYTTLNPIFFDITGVQYRSLLERLGHPVLKKAFKNNVVEFIKICCQQVCYQYGLECSSPSTTALMS